MRPALELLKTAAVLVGLWAVLGLIAWAAGALPSDTSEEVPPADEGDAAVPSDAGVDAPVPDDENEADDAAGLPAVPLAEPTTRIALCTAPAEVVWAVGDLAGGDDEEIVVACADTVDLLAWGVNESAPVRIARVTLRPGTHVRDLAIGDVDADGRPDLVVSLDDGLYLLPREVTGGFAAPRTLGPGRYGAVTLAALDADPGLDLAVVHGADPRPELWLHRGGPAPVRSATAPAPVATSALVTLDLDVDGHLDVVAVGGQQILLAFGDSRATVARSRSITPGGRGAATAAVDGSSTTNLVIESDAAPCILAPAPELAESAGCTTLSSLEANVRDLRATATGLVGIRHPEIVTWTPPGLSVAATLATASFGAHQVAMLAHTLVVLGSVPRDDGSRELQILRIPEPLRGSTRIGDGERIDVVAAPLVLELTLPDPDAP